MIQKKAVIIGAGPAGLTAAFELLEKTDIQPLVFEMTGDIGGISKTVPYKGNRIDIGGHRFFSKSNRVMEWWQRFMPLQGAPARDDRILNREVPLSKAREAPDPETEDQVMLFRQRVSRILFLRRFFDYPIRLSPATLKNLGLVRVMEIGLSYLQARLSPISPEKSLEDFFINRFGRVLYSIFFENYTEKVWGVSCDRISPEWGAQRIKGLSISKSVLHAAKNLVARDRSIEQKSTETSLIEQFLYPKFGPGQMWEEVARTVQAKGGKVFLNREVTGLDLVDGRIQAVRVEDRRTGELETVPGAYFFSTMPVKDLVAALGPDVPEEVRNVAQGLVYRDFITVGLLLSRIKLKNRTRIKTVGDLIPDNWIYVQEPDVKLGRLQVFNNWSPYMVRDPEKIWIGLEYFCNQGDDLWEKPDQEMIDFAGEELVRIGVVDPSDILDGVVIRMPKTYPAYFGTYASFDLVRDYVDDIRNLFLIGRNGMHRYNNQDHSMLAAMTAVENILSGSTSKDNIWAVNTESEFHEER